MVTASHSLTHSLMDTHSTCMFPQKYPHSGETNPPNVCVCISVWNNDYTHWIHYWWMKSTVMDACMESTKDSILNWIFVTFNRNMCDSHTLICWFVCESMFVVSVRFFSDNSTAEGKTDLNKVFFFSFRIFAIDFCQSYLVLMVVSSCLRTGIAHAHAHFE